MTTNIRLSKENKYLTKISRNDRKTNDNHYGSDRKIKAKNKKIDPTKLKPKNATKPTEIPVSKLLQCGKPKTDNQNKTD